MNRTIKEVTVKRSDHDGHEWLRTHLGGFKNIHEFAQRFQAFNGLTPYEYIGKTWTSEPHRFIVNPIHQMRDQKPDQ